MVVVLMGVTGSGKDDRWQGLGKGTRMEVLRCRRLPPCGEHREDAPGDSADR